MLSSVLRPIDSPLSSDVSLLSLSIDVLAGYISLFGLGRLRIISITRTNWKIVTPSAAPSSLSISTCSVWIFRTSTFPASLSFSSKCAFFTNSDYGIKLCLCLLSFSFSYVSCFFISCSFACNPILALFTRKDLVLLCSIWSSLTIYSKWVYSNYKFLILRQFKILSVVKRSGLITISLVFLVLIMDARWWWWSLWWWCVWVSIAEMENESWVSCIS